jgi:O-antigen/teichoic acid export membrane protein
MNLTVITGGSSALSLLVTVITARQLGPSGRGLITLFITVGATASLFLSCGINTAARYYLPKRDKVVTLSHYHGLGLILTAVATVVGSGVAFVFARRGGFATPAVMLLTTALCALTMVIWLESDALNAVGLLVRNAIINGAGTVIQVVILVGLSLFSRLTLTGALAALDVGMAAQALVCIAALARAGHRVQPAFDRRASRLLLKKGVPAMGANAGLSVTFRFDRFVIAAVLGSVPLGVYSIAVSGSEALRLFPAAWGQVAFYRLASGEATLRSLRRRRRWILMAMAVLLLVWAIVTPFVVHEFVGHRYDGAIRPWRLLLIGEIGIMMYQIDARLLGAMGRTVASGIAGVVGLVIVVPLDLLLIPRHGLTGAAEASVVAYLATGLTAYLALALGRDGHSRARGIPGGGKEAGTAASTTLHGERAVLEMVTDDPLTHNPLLEESLPVESEPP